MHAINHLLPYLVAMEDRGDHWLSTNEQLDAIYQRLNTSAHGNEFSHESERNKL